MVRIISLLVLLFSSVFCLSQESTHISCCGKKEVIDGFVKSINAFVEKTDSLDFYLNSSDSDQCSYVTNKLNECVTKNMFSKAKKHNYVNLIYNKNYFSIHAFEFKNHKKIEHLQNDLNSRKTNHFNDEGATKFEFETIKNVVYIFISSRSSYLLTVNLFKRYLIDESIGN